MRLFGSQLRSYCSNDLAKFADFARAGGDQTKLAQQL